MPSDASRPTGIGGESSLVVGFAGAGAGAGAGPVIAALYVVTKEVVEAARESVDRSRPQVSQYGDSRSQHGAGGRPLVVLIMAGVDCGVVR